MKKVLVRREMLGNRETCWSLLNNNQIVEMTGKQIADALKKNEQIAGVKLGKEDVLELDSDIFFCRNVMEHRHCDNYTPMNPEESGMAGNTFYICLGVHAEKDKMSYDFISTRFERVRFEEEEVRIYYKIGLISAGLKVNDDGTVVVSDLLLDKKDSSVSKKVEKISKSEEETPVIKKGAK